MEERKCKNCVYASKYALEKMRDCALSGKEVYEESEACKKGIMKSEIW